MSRGYELIQKKRDGGVLTEEEIAVLLYGYLGGEIPDYQMAAFLMAVFFRGMSPRETTTLTMAMVHTGEVLDLSAIRGVKVDKHSTGGVGDKTSLVLVPLVAAAGAPVAKLSGRGLGHTGGTLDKLESIPEMRIELTPKAFIDQVNRIGCAIASQTANLVPADKKLYALRDLTATVDSIPLIASSVMSKKIAAGADAIVLDVKTGSGAFMKDLDSARTLAEMLVAIGTGAERRTVAVISDMEQPLGFAVGNALEVVEAIQTLRGEGPPDLRELCLTLGSHMLVLANAAGSLDDARSRLEFVLESGRGLEKLKELIGAQGGDAGVVDEPQRLPQAAVRLPVPAWTEGIVRAIDAEGIGAAAMALGAGRAKREDRINPAVGIILRRKVGDPVSRGDPVADVLAADAAQGTEVAGRVQAAYTIGRDAPPPRPLIHEVVGPQAMSERSESKG
jgi:pyrimidine-nucleoside phosphorylase